MGVSKIKVKDLIELLQRDYAGDDFVGFVPHVVPRRPQDASRYERRARYKRLGLCISCGQGPLCTNTHCIRCAEKNRVRALNWKDKQKRAMIAQKAALANEQKQAIITPSP